MEVCKNVMGKLKDYLFPQGKDEFLGRSMCSPIVKLNSEMDITPKLLWCPVMNGDKACGPHFENHCPKQLQSHRSLNMQGTLKQNHNFRRSIERSFSKVLYYVLSHFQIVHCFPHYKNMIWLPFYNTINICKLLFFTLNASYAISK